MICFAGQKKNFLRVRGPPVAGIRYIGLDRAAVERSRLTRAGGQKYQLLTTKVCDGPLAVRRERLSRTISQPDRRSTVRLPQIDAVVRAAAFAALLKE